MSKIGLIAFLLLVPFCLMSQTTYTVEECIRTAIANNLEIKQNGITAEMNESAYKQSKLNRWPTANVSASHSYGFGRRIDPTTNAFTNLSVQSNSFGLNSGVTLFNGGLISNSIERAKQILDKTATDRKVIENRVALEVAGRYLEVLLSKERLKVARNQKERTQLELDRVSKLIAAGTMAGSSKYDLEAQLATGDYQIVQAENAVEKALINLKAAMLIPLEEEIDIAAINIPVPAKDDIVALHPDVIIAEALLNQPSIKSAEQQVVLSETGVKIARANLYPTLSLGGGLNTNYSDQSVTATYDRNNISNVLTSLITESGENIYQPTPAFTTAKTPFFDQLNNNFGQSVGLSLSIPIFNNGSVKNQIRQNELQVKSSQVAVELQKQQLEQNIMNAYLDAELALKAYKSAEIQVKAQEKAEEFAQKRYELGSGSVYDLFTAQNNRLAAELQLAQSKYDLIYKLKVLEFYKNNEFKF